MQTYNKRAFSLIELLVALSILAVVAAVIVPRFLNVRTQAAATATQAQQRTIQRAVQQFASLGGTIGSSAGSSEVLNFLAITPSAVGTKRTATTNVSDSDGNFGSTTVSLSLGNTSTSMANGSAAGYNTSGATAQYSDGAGTVYDIKIAGNPGTVWFKPTSVAATGASTIQ